MHDRLATPMSRRRGGMNITMPIGIDPHRRSESADKNQPSLLPRGVDREGERMSIRLRAVGTSSLSWFVILFSVAGSSHAGRHPTLIDPTTTNCAECHGDILDAAVRHAPAVDDCLSCHDIEKRNGESVATLTGGTTELCLTCHDDLQAAARGSLQKPHAPVVEDCTSCHDPHASSEEQLLLQAAKQLCSSCHEAGDTDAVHPIPVSRSDCRTCHASHGSDNDHMLDGQVLHVPFAEGSCDGCHRTPRGTKVRLHLEGDRLCYACHTGLEQRFTTGSVHTAVSEGQCLGCHDPHLANRPDLLKSQDDELCYGCHPAIKTKSTSPTAHAAVVGGCGGCHDPHQSAFSAQLLEEVTSLCGVCHDLADEHLATVHLRPDLRSTDCVECHDPHGSSSLHLIASGSVHPPFVEDCQSCHRGGAHQLVAGGGSSLCYACHSEIQEIVDTAPVRHPAMETGSCVVCHSPHASSEPKLLRSPGGVVCTTCHEGQRPNHGEVSHGATEWFGCQSCHLPHGGADQHLLRARGNQLCLGCHLEGEVSIDASGTARLPGSLSLQGVQAESLKVIDLDPSRTRNHPISGHPVAGLITTSRRAKLPRALVGTEMTCLSCHVPHTAVTSQLFAYGADSQAELCAACHQG